MSFVGIVHAVMKKRSLVNEIESFNIGCFVIVGQYIQGERYSFRKVIYIIKIFQLVEKMGYTCMC